ncbi:hypothetical protein C8F01DRAFT_1143270 [Mycena amicta]|nr:hypothetical protein C8F01DRAFT_1143270 [Mycena amicta]
MTECVGTSDSGLAEIEVDRPSETRSRHAPQTIVFHLRPLFPGLLVQSRAGTATRYRGRQAERDSFSKCFAASRSPSPLLPRLLFIPAYDYRSLIPSCRAGPCCLSDRARRCVAVAGDTEGVMSRVPGLLRADDESKNLRIVSPFGWTNDLRFELVVGVLLSRF